MRGKNNSKRFFYLNSKLWFWPFFTGALLGLGYSITKNILISKIYTEEVSKQSQKQKFLRKDFLGFKDSSAGDEKSMQSYRTNNQIKQKIKTVTQNSLLAKKKGSPEIKVFNSQNTHLTFTLDLSEQKNPEKLAAFHNHQSFFQIQSIENLIESIDKQKKLNLLE